MSLKFNLFLALSLEQDIPDYDMDSEDEHWISVESKAELTTYRFEQMMDKLEKGSTCTLDDAKALVKRNEVSQEVFDYWVSKRLKTVIFCETLIGIAILMYVILFLETSTAIDS